MNVTVPNHVGPTPERQAKGDLREIAEWGKRGRKWASKYPSEVERLGTVCNSRTGKPYLTPQQVEVGLWLMGVHERRHAEPRVVGSYGQTIPGYESGLEGVITAKDKADKEWHAAMMRIGFPLSNVVYQLVVEDSRLNAWELDLVRLAFDELYRWRFR